jgi:hypothetical protein
MGNSSTTSNVPSAITDREPPMFYKAVETELSLLVDLPRPLLNMVLQRVCNVVSLVRLENTCRFLYYVSHKEEKDNSPVQAPWGAVAKALWRGRYNKDVEVYNKTMFLSNTLNSNMWW